MPESFRHTKMKANLLIYLLCFMTHGALLAVEPRCFLGDVTIFEMGTEASNYMASHGGKAPAEWAEFTRDTVLEIYDRKSRERLGLSLAQRFTFVTNMVVVPAFAPGSNRLARVLIVENGPVDLGRGRVFRAAVVSATGADAFGTLVEEEKMTDALWRSGVTIATPTDWHTRGVPNRTGFEWLVHHWRQMSRAGQAVILWVLFGVAVFVVYRMLLWMRRQSR